MSFGKDKYGRTLAEGLKRDFLPKDKCRGGLLRSLAVGLAFLWAVDAVEADAFRVLVMKDFDSVAVKDGDDGAGEVGKRGQNMQKENHGKGCDGLANHTSYSLGTVKLSLTITDMKIASFEEGCGKSLGRKHGSISPVPCQMVY